MLSFFMHPGFVLAGAPLVSLPIIIHLINRMRFKRIRWAAMEFLLKSQKRNRRRLIIEQLILLALRCLLVLLTVILVSRYLGFSFAMFDPKNTLHVIVLDDTLSMTDHWQDEGEAKTAFQSGKSIILNQLAKNIVQARTAQQVVVLPLSEPSRRLFDQRLNAQSMDELQRALADYDCTTLRIDLARGVQAAKEIFDRVPQDQRFLHVVSDFRQRDWSEPDAATLTQALEEVGRAGIKTNLIDAAHPNRVEQQRTPLFHDNLAIVDLRPETRVAARDVPVQFTVTVANYGMSERKNVRVAIKVNGGQRLEGDVNLTIQPAETKSDTLLLSFNELGFNQVSANLENEEVGLQGDNVRYAVIDVRKQVPVLVIDGDPGNGQRPGGDTYHVQASLTSERGYQITPRGINELEQPNLDQYASIYLLNVRDMSEKALRNLENYVRDGGSVAFFLGEKVRADFYNDKLYNKGKGIFPAPLQDRPYPPLAEPEMETNLFDGQLKLFVRDESHPIFAELWKPAYRPAYNFLPIKRYFPVQRRGWEPVPGKVEEIATLPNHRSMRDYAAAAQEIVDTLDQPIRDPAYAKYKPALEQHKRAVHETLLGDKPLYELANALEALLKDRGEPNDPNKPNLVEFWNKSEYQKLRGRIEQFRQTVQLGDPLVITEVFGKGKVVAFMTTAGLAWNDWAGNSPAAVTYPGMMVELQKFLTSGGGDSNRVVGSALTLEVDSGRFDSKMRCFYQPESRDADANKPEADATKSTGLVDRGETLGAESSGRIRFLFDGARKPGLYRFEIPLRTDRTPAGGTAAAVDARAFVFNVDPIESDLRRAQKDDLEHAAVGAKLRSGNAEWAGELANKQNDLSESAWFYLLFLVILVVEQALAVHLSFHLKGSEGTSPIRTARPETTAA